MFDVFAKPSPWMDDELQMFDRSVEAALAQLASARRREDWRENGIVDRSVWKEAADAGLLGLSISPDFGGAGGDFRHEAVLLRRLALICADGWQIPLHNAICAAYIQTYGTEAQKRRWLPGIVSGSLILAIAMTEPGTGSDLQAIRTTATRDGSGYVVNGQKTFISNGQNADLIIVVATTDLAKRGRGLGLLVVEAATAQGFTRGRNLSKVGLEMADTSELFFNDVRVPAEHLLGEIEGQGFAQLMRELPKERLMIAIESLGTIETALNITLEYVNERKAFGQRLVDFQHTQFQLADCKTEAMIARTFVDHCIDLYHGGTLDATTASMAKYWVSERAQKIVDTCQQLFGGYGYMNEYPIAQMYKDIRVKRVYGGTSEIMKLLIARTCMR